MPVARRIRPAHPVVVVFLAVLTAACSTTPAVSFDPTGACTSDGRQSGAYPTLEAVIPATFRGEAPTRLDSGRNCSKERLGSLSTHGIREVRFAGGLWETANRSGVTIALFEAPGLTRDILAEFYDTGARSARKTENITTGSLEVAGVEGRRLDTLNEDSFQSVVVFPGAQADQAYAVLVASDVAEADSRAAHDALVLEAAEAALGNMAGP